MSPAPSSREPRTSGGIHRVCSSYALVGSTWVVGSNLAIALLVDDRTRYVALTAANGLMIVAVSTALIVGLSRPRPDRSRGGTSPWAGASVAAVCLAMVVTVTGVGALLARTGRAEALSDLAARGTSVVVVGLLSVTVCGLIVALVWQRQAAEHRLRVRRQEWLREGVERKYEALSKYANDAIILADEGGRVVESNVRASALYQYDGPELRGLKLSDLDAGEEDRRARGEAVGDAERGSVYTATHRRKDGTLVPVEVSSRSVEVEGRTYRQAIVRDVTERARAETQLRFYRFLLENVHDPVYLISPADGFRLTYLNEAGCRHFGLTRGAVLGQSLSDCHAGLGVDALPELWARLRDQKHQVFETRHTLNDGRVVPVEVSNNYLKYGDEEYMAGFFRDISERRRTEAAFLVAKEAAEAGSRAKGEFLANISHEIRTPMNGIIGMTELALATELSRPQREYLAMVHSSAEALLAVLNDVLDLSKIEAGRVDLEAVPFDPVGVVADAIRPFALQAHQRGLELAFRHEPGVPSAVTGDPVRLRQVLTNLVANAVKFTERGEVVVTLAAAPGGGLAFEVSDTGIGVPEDRLAAIFEPFTQADGSMTRRFGGTGLGLPISAKLVALMGGELTAKSRAGVGSTFGFTAATPAFDGEIPTPAPDECPAGRRALVVDDNATNRLILVESLTAWGMRTAAAASGEEALDAIAGAAADPFEVILIDSLMPGMGGFEVAERVGRDGRLSRARVMMLSSLYLSADALRCDDLGVDVFLVKPVRPAELRAAVRAVLGREAEPGSTEADPGPDPGVDSPMRVLVTDDNDVNLLLTQGTLGKMGHRVVTARNGREALDALAGGGFDLVLMDLQMNGLDGFGVLAAIRDRERTGDAAKTPVIALTAHALGGDRRRCLDAGFDDYISKPVRPAALSRAIAAVTAAGPRRPPPAGRPVSSARPPAPALDRAASIDLVGGDEAFLRDIAASLLDHFGPMLSDLRVAVHRGDAAEAYRAGHKLAGSLTNVAAPRMLRLVRAIEEKARGNDLTDSRRGLEAVEAEALRLRGELEELVSGGENCAGEPRTGATTVGGP